MRKSRLIRATNFLGRDRALAIIHPEREGAIRTSYLDTVRTYCPPIKSSCIEYSRFSRRPGEYSRAGGAHHAGSSENPACVCTFHAMLRRDDLPSFCGAAKYNGTVCNVINATSRAAPQKHTQKRWPFALRKTLRIASISEYRANSRRDSARTFLAVATRRKIIIFRRYARSRVVILRKSTDLSSDFVSSSSRRFGKVVIVFSFRKSPTREYRSLVPLPSNIFET